MAELITIARPYAKAAFEYALENRNLSGWSDMLGYAAAVASDQAMVQCLDNPQLTFEQKSEIFNSVCEGNADASSRNFICQLAQNKRLSILPEIYALFVALVAEQEKTVDVNIQTAYALSDEQAEKITQALNRRLGRKVNLQSEIDKRLLGGMIIRAGDMVIDGSIRGKIARLNQQIG